MRSGAGPSNHLGTPALYSGLGPEYEITHFDPANKTDDANRRCKMYIESQLAAIIQGGLFLGPTNSGSSLSPRSPKSSSRSSIGLSSPRSSPSSRGRTMFIV